MLGRDLVDRRKTWETPLSLDLNDELCQSTIAAEDRKEKIRKKLKRRIKIEKENRISALHKIESINMSSK